MGRSTSYHPGTIHQTGTDFKCKFSFFWLIKEVIEAKRDIATFTVTGMPQYIFVLSIDMINNLSP